MQDGSQISLKTLTQHTHLTATLMATGDNDKPVVVRIKRKATKPRLHAFLLEINKRPLKQPLQDFQKLSISASSGKDEIEARKVFVQHVETVTTSEATVDIVKLSVAAVADVLEDKTKSEELRHAFKKDNVLAKDAWFEQIWRSKKEKEKEMHYKALYEMFNFYDIVRVDVEERSNQVQKQEDTCTEDHMLKQDHYVYDYYTVNNDINVDDEDALRSFRQVQVNDGDLFHGSDESEYNSEDSNAKDNQQSVYAKESSSTPLKAINEKLVIVRVKRKASQARLDAFWLEINERPLKRQQLDFEKQSVSDSSGKYEIKARNVFVRHMETVTVSEATVDIVKLFKSNFADVRNGKIKSEERRRAFKKDNRHDQNLSKARQQQEVLAKTARFEQMWRSRRANQKEIHDKASSEIFHFYDIVRVDVEERSNEVQKQDDRSTDDHISKKDNYVYDYYTEKFDFNVDDDDASFPYTRVHVDDEDFCYWSDESEYVSEDSNAEDCPRKDYSNEMSDEEEDPNAEDNPQNYYPNEASDEEKYSNVTDNPRNDYPNEMSDKEEDSNAEDNAQDEMSDEEAYLNTENNPRNVYPNEMSDEEEEEEEPPLMNQKTNNPINDYPYERSDFNDNPGNYYPCETSDEESDLNADDNPSNYYPYATSDEELDLTETSDEESDLNAEDNPRNYYPYEMSDEESDLNAEDNPQNGYPYEMSDEEADLNSEDCPQDDYPNKMFHEEKEVEGEEGVEESQVSNEMFHEEQEVEEEEGVENQVFNESYNEGESDSIIASIDFEQFSEDEIHYNDIYHDDSHCGYYDDFDNDDGGDDYSDDGGDDYYDDGGGYSDSDDW